MKDEARCSFCWRAKVSVLENKPLPDGTDRCWNHIGQDPRCFRIAYERQLATTDRLDEQLEAAERHIAQTGLG